MQAPNYLVPGSILVGCAMIAFGAYLGLRERGARTPTVASSTETVAATPSASASTEPSVTAAPPDASAFAPPERSEVARAAADALATHRARLVSKCWAPSLAKAKDPPTVKLMLNVTFGPDGKQLARGLSETRGAFRADVTACVQRELPALEIAPPGVQVETEIPLAFP